jgi:hypothetical protein
MPDYNPNLYDPKRDKRIDIDRGVANITLRIWALCVLAILIFILRP